MYTGVVIPVILQYVKALKRKPFKQEIKLFSNLENHFDAFLIAVEHVTDINMRYDHSECIIVSEVKGVQLAIYAILLSAR